MSVSMLDPEGSNMSTITTINPATEKEIQAYVVLLAECVFFESHGP